MEKPTRRSLLKAAAVGGVTATGLGAAVFGTERGFAAPAPVDQNRGRGKGDDDDHDHGDDDEQLNGKRALAVVSFGQWEVDKADERGPLDRMAAVVPPNRNVHKHLPFEADIEAGGAVSFMISGVHQILIYDGRTVADVQAAWVAAGSPTLPGIPGGPGLVEYPTDRVYRGLNPIGQPQDRIESVNFLQPGRYLVVCGFVPHFNEGMHGFVRVREAD